MTDTYTKSRKSSFQRMLEGILLIMTASILVMLISPVVYSQGDGVLQTFVEKDTLYAIRFTLICSVLSTLAATVTGLLIGYCLSRYTFFLSKVLKVIFCLPIVLPPIVLGLSLLILLGPLLGESFEQIGLKFVFTPLGVVTGQYFVVLPIMVRLFNNIFDTIPASIYEAGKMDGAGEGVVFVRIVLPMCRNPIYSSISMGFARAMGEFGATMMLAGIVSNRTVTLPGAIYLNIATGDMNKAIAAAAVLLLVSCICLGAMTLLGTAENSA